MFQKTNLDIFSLAHLVVVVEQFVKSFLYHLRRSIEQHHQLIQRDHHNVFCRLLLRIRGFFFYILLIEILKYGYYYYQFCFSLARTNIHFAIFLLNINYFATQTLTVAPVTYVVLKLYYRTVALATYIVFGLLYRNIISDDTGPSSGCKSNTIMINILLNSFP